MKAVRQNGTHAIPITLGAMSKFVQVKFALCMCEGGGGMGWTCSWECRCPWGPEEKVRFPGTRVAGSFEQPDLSAENRIEFL